MRNRILVRVFLEPQRKFLPRAYLVCLYLAYLYFGGINLAQYRLPHGFLLYVYDLRMPSLLLPFALFKPQQKVRLEAESWAEEEQESCLCFLLFLHLRDEYPVQLPTHLHDTGCVLNSCL